MSFIIHRTEHSKMKMYLQNTIFGSAHTANEIRISIIKAITQRERERER